MEPENYRKAKKRVKKKKEFRDHLKSFMITNIIMLGMGWMFGFFNAWLIVVFLWGIGIFSHYADVYGLPGFEQDEDWERREMEKELRRMERLEAEKGSMQDELDSDEFLDLDSPSPEKQKNYNEEDLV